MKILKYIGAIVLGIIIGSTVNMGLIMISGDIIPPPEGVNLEDMESLKANMHRFAPINFLMPFLAHAIGTLIGALTAVLIAGRTKKFPAYVIGFFFLLAGIANIVMLPSPLWFAFVDLVFAYIPMAWLACKLVKVKAVPEVNKVGEFGLRM